MIGDDLQELFHRLEKAAREFLSAPGVLSAMGLDERAGQLRRVCAARLDDQALTGRLSDMQQAARSADPDLVRVLLAEVRQAMARHGIAGQSPD